MEENCREPICWWLLRYLLIEEFCLIKYLDVLSLFSIYHDDCQYFKKFNHFYFTDITSEITYFASTVAAICLIHRSHEDAIKLHNGDT